MIDFSQFYTTTDHFTIIPAVMLALFGCAILLFDFFGLPRSAPAKVPARSSSRSPKPSPATGSIEQQAYLTRRRLTELRGFSGAVTVDGFSIFFNWIFLIAALIVAVVSYKYLEIAGEHHGEYYGLILFAQCGMYFLAAGTDLVTLFIGLELMALCFYVMVGFLRGDKRSNEAALEIPAARRVLDRLPGLRLLRHVRHGRLHQAGRHPGRDLAAPAVGPGRLPRDGHHRRRTALQDLRRALPHVGAGRV